MEALSQANTLSESIDHLSPVDKERFLEVFEEALADPSRLNITELISRYSGPVAGMLATANAANLEHPAGNDLAVVVAAQL